MIELAPEHHHFFPYRQRLLEMQPSSSSALDFGAQASSSALPPRNDRIASLKRASNSPAPTGAQSPASKRSKTSGAPVRGKGPESDTTEKTTDLPEDPEEDSTEELVDPVPPTRSTSLQGGSDHDMDS
jgi:hypothetical protein